MENEINDPATVTKKPRKRKTPAAAKVAKAPAVPKKAKAPAKPKAPRKPTVKKPPVAAREVVRTESARKKKLAKLPSLKKPVAPEPVVPALEPTAGPPPQISPPPVYEPEVTGFIDRGLPIPDHYGMDRVVVLPRDPNWVYVYWELKGGAVERLRFLHSAEVIDNARWVLNVESLRDHASAMVDIDMRMGQWYLKTAPGERFQVALGFVDQQGSFNPVVKAPELRTPTTGISNVADDCWIVERAELEQLLEVGGTLPITGQPGNEVRIVRTEMPRAQGIFSWHGGPRSPEVATPEPVAANPS